MTCIVAKPGHMAADSRDTGETKRQCAKIFVKHTYLVGGAGASAPLNVLEFAVKWPVKPSVAAFTCWIYDLHDADKLDFDEVSLIVCTSRRVYVMEGRQAFDAGRVGAVGSGAAYARGFLEGRPKDLAGAVAAACKFDPWCAGPIRQVRL